MASQQTSFQYRLATGRAQGSGKLPLPYNKAMQPTGVDFLSSSCDPAATDLHSYTSSSERVTLASHGLKLLWF